MSQVQVFSRGGLAVEIGFEQPIPVMIPARQTATVQRHMNCSAFCLCPMIFFENDIFVYVCVAVGVKGPKKQEFIAAGGFLLYYISVVAQFKQKKGKSTIALRP
jgi:hypothetical protein